MVCTKYFESKIQSNPRTKSKSNPNPVQIQSKSKSKSKLDGLDLSKSMQLYTEHLGTAQVYVSERDSMFVLLQNPESSARSHFNGVYFEVGENSQIPGSLTMTNAGPSSIICILMQFPPASWGADSLDMVFPLRFRSQNVSVCLWG